MMNQKSTTGRLRRALLSRLSLLKSPVNYDPYRFLLLGGQPSARPVRLFQKTHTLSMQQQRQHQQQHQQQQHHQQQQQHQQLQEKITVSQHSAAASGASNTMGGPQDPVPPHEGVLKTNNNQPGISIEQLFEDIYSLPSSKSPHLHGQHGNLADSAPCLSSHELGAKGSRTMPSSRVMAAQRRFAKMSTVVPAPSSSKAASHSSASTSVDPPLLRAKTLSIPSLVNSATAATRLQKGNADVDHGVSPPRQLGSRGSRRGGSANSAPGGALFLPLSGAEASKGHASRLTDREKGEIKSFKTVYYLGQLSAKKAAIEDGAKNEGFDDKDGFYVCKQRDHLLFRYEIQELLGKGTFGQVVKAWDHKTSSLVAMKIVKNERPFLRQAKEEVRILEVLKKQDKQDNLNLVHILDSFKFRGHVCIAFELLGMSLHQLLKKTRGQGFSLSRIQKLTRGILRCLDVLSKNRIIHCDIKPENILLRRSAPGVTAGTGAAFSDCSIKVIDFGSSCYEQQQIYTYIQSRYYRAPEVIMGARYTCAIDMWSLACVIGELFTSQPLFAGQDEHDQLATIMEVCGVPPAAVVERCKRSDKFFQGQTPRYLNNPSKRVRRGPPNSVSLSSLLKDTDDAVFLDFMQRALCWDPAARLTPAEALNHPWILRGQGSRAQGGDTTPSASAAQLARVKSSDKAVRGEPPHDPQLPSSKNSATRTSDARTSATRNSDARNSASINSTTTRSSVTISSATTASSATKSSVSMCSKISSTTYNASHNNSSAPTSTKLPSHLLRARSDTSQLAARARAGPTVSLPAWDRR